MRVHGARHAVTVCITSRRASRLTKVSPRPRRTSAGRPRRPVRLRSPWPYVKPSIATLRRTVAVHSRRGSGRPENAPPWLSFSRRCPWVTTPGTSTSVTNGSAPSVPPAWNAIGMIAIDSYHDARRLS